MTEFNFFENIYQNHPTVISTSLAALVAFVVAVVGISKQRQSSREKNSLDFEANYKDSKEIRDSWVLLRQAAAKDSSYLVELVTKRKKDDEEARAAIVTILNEWERAANAIEHSLFDEKLLYKAYGTIVIKLFQDLSPFILHCQKQNPRVFVSFTKLSIEWQIKRAKSEINAPSQDMSKSLMALHKSYRAFNDEYKKSIK